MWSVRQAVQRGFGRLAVRTGLGRLHRDQVGAYTLEYAMVFAAIVVPLALMFEKLFYVLTEYFGLIAFYVSWPFL